MKAILIILLTFNGYVHCQCLIQTIDSPLPMQSEKLQYVTYALRAERMYNNENFKVDFSVEKQIFKTVDKTKIVYNLVFNVFGSVQKIFIPDVVEITLENGNNVILYIPKRSNYHVSEAGLYVYADCYNNFSEKDSEIQLLLSNSIKRVTLKNQSDYLVIKNISSDFFQSKFKCLLDKN
jgi:hypothetical protein